MFSKFIYQYLPLGIWVLKLIRSSFPRLEASRLGHHVQMMIAAKYVMTNRNNVVECASYSEENNDKRKRENNPAVMFFHNY